VSQAYWKPGDSHFWVGLIAAKKHIFRFGFFTIKDGSEIHFWEDKWLGNTTLREQYPALYCIVRNKNDTVAQVLSSNLPGCIFSAGLGWLPSYVMATYVIPFGNSQPDKRTRCVFRWSLTKSGSFTVDSMYHALMHSEIPVVNNNQIWKPMVPLKMKIFMWYLRRGVVLTKDNIARRN
jgi:hypothetical protein